MKKVCALLLALILLFSFCACGKKGPDLPVYNGIDYEEKDDNIYIIPGITDSDFDAYLELLRENGFAFFSSDALPHEEEAVNMYLWQGAKGDMEITVLLMVDPATWTQYLEIYIHD